MSCGQLALKQLGIKVDNYFASEIDPHAIYVAKKNFPNTIHLGDINDWRDWELPKIDLIIGGSPCQGFSFAGKQLNFDDPRSKLLFTFIDVYNHHNPISFLLENVRMKQESKNVINEQLHTEPFFINSDLFVQQNRPRLYWTNINVLPLPKRPHWDGKYLSYRRSYWRENKSGVSPCLVASMGMGGGHVPFIIENGKKRVLTINELEQLQGLPVDYTAGVVDTQRKKMIGNGWTVNVIEHIFQGLVNK